MVSLDEFVEIFVNHSESLVPLLVHGLHAHKLLSLELDGTEEVVKYIFELSLVLRAGYPAEDVDGVLESSQVSADSSARSTEVKKGLFLLGWDLSNELHADWLLGLAHGS